MSKKLKSRLCVSTNHCKCCPNYQIQPDSRAKLYRRTDFDLLELVASLFIRKTKRLSAYNKRHYAELLTQHYIKKFKIQKYNTICLYFQTCCDKIERIMFPASLLNNVAYLIRDPRSVTEATNLKFLNIIQHHVNCTTSKVWSD